MWLLVSSTNADENHPILGEKRYVVGRSGCDITINDPSVSRKQAVLMMAHYESNVVKSFITPTLTLEDTSKFGTMVNGESVKKQPGCSITLKDKDKIHFGGSPASHFVATYQPFVVTTSCLEKQPKKNLQHVMCLLGGHLVREWRASCDLLIMAKINVTIKVICAINNQKPIVTPDYLEHLHKFMMGEREAKPEPRDYLPEVVDKEVPAGVCFHPDIRRASLLKDLKFYFLSAHQFNKTNLAVSTAGGLPILLEDGMEEDAELMTQEGTIVVAVSKEVLSSLSATCQKFVRTVCLVLKKKNLRMVTDPEIGWAILTCNTDDFCNPKSAITPSMYSSMASQSLSQMTDMEDIFPDSKAMPAARVSPVADSSLQHRPKPRPAKRPASTMENSDVKEVLSSNSLLSPSPVSKKSRPDPVLSPSQDSMVATEKNSTVQMCSTESVSKFKTPAPEPSRKKVVEEDKNFADEREKDLSLRLGDRNSLASCSDQDTKGNNQKSCDEKKLSSVVNSIEKNDIIAESINSSKCSVENEENSSKSTETSFSSSIPKTTHPSNGASEPKETPSLSASGFLSTKHSTTNNSNCDDILAGGKQTTSTMSPLCTSSVRKKRKKRALFSDSDEEGDKEVSSLPSKKQIKATICDEQNNSNNDRVSCESIVVDRDSLTSSIVCNGVVEAPIAVKDEPVSESLSNSTNTDKRGGGLHQDPLGSALWVTVKKEDPDGEQRICELKKQDLELELDSEGVPLQDCCQVKVVDLVVREKSRHLSDKEAKTASQSYPNGVKNFKKFRKTCHAGSSGLPTIIGGHDLEPYQDNKLVPSENLLTEAEVTENGTGFDDKGGLFDWDDDKPAKKKRAKRT